jgi:nucleotide-binding universal stress UspA family protein
VVGVDGSRSADHALRHASDEAALRRCDLDVVCCWPDPSLIDVTAEAEEDEVPAMAEREARHVVDEAVRTARCRGYQLSVVSHLVHGAPGPTLTALADGAALLVVGRGGLNRNDDQSVGPVSQYCLAHANCPVEVVSIPVRRNHAPSPLRQLVDSP